MSRTALWRSVFARAAWEQIEPIEAVPCPHVGDGSQSAAMTALLPLGAEESCE